MTSNPYGRNHGPQAHGGHGGPYGPPQPGPWQGGPVPTAPPFVDPYQPRDRQPRYLPPISRRELNRSAPYGAFSGAGPSPSGATRAPGGRGRYTPDMPHAARTAGWCMVLCILFGFNAAALIALVIAVAFHRMSRSRFVRAWAANTVNVLVPYIALRLVFGIVLGIVDSIAHTHLSDAVGNALQAVLFLVLLVGAVLAFRGRYVRAPLPFTVMKA